MVVSADGNNGRQCLNLSSNTPCKTASYPISNGFSNICLHGTLYNTSESIGLLYSVNKINEFDIFGKECLLLHSEIMLSCSSDDICTMFLRNCTIKFSTILLNNTFVTFSNMILEETLIKCMTNYQEEGNIQIQFEVSIVSCYESHNCGLYLNNCSAAKVVFMKSHLNNFRLEISISQLILSFNETNINMPSINVQVKAFEYLRIPTIIQFGRVKVLQNSSSLINEEMSTRIKREAESKLYDNFVFIDVTNPHIIVKESAFIGAYLEIQSKRQYFEPVVFLLFIESSLFMESYHVGNGGGLSITSEVRNSEMTVLDCIFSNNSAIKGTSNLKGRDGGLYVEAKSLKLVMTNSTFLDNEASESGLALYTSQGVDVSLINCTFQYSVNPNAPIQQSILFVSGRVDNFYGFFRVFNTKPKFYVGPIDVFYIGQGANLNIETYCPRWYNPIIEYAAPLVKIYAVQNAKYRCDPCSNNYYSTAEEVKTLYFYGNQNSTLAEIVNGNASTVRCAECPYGALCMGNEVIPRPNYWGYWYEGELVFQQCPAGYCCSGSDSSPCNMYDYCPGNKTGTLCGACQEGFSVSILTGSCTPDSQCGEDRWFWFIALLAAMAYALWYTLKDDIFALLFISIGNMKQVCKRSQVNDIPIQTMSSNNQSRLSVSTVECIDNGSNIDPDADNINDVPLDTVSSDEESLLVNNHVPGKDACNNMDNNETIPEEKSGQIDASQTEANKGYFGIVTYFVQMAAVIKIQIEFSDINKSEPFLDKMMNSIGNFLNIEFTQTSFDVCPITGLTTYGKYVYKLMFLLGIYVSWLGLFLMTKYVITVLRKQKEIKTSVKKLESFKLKLVIGLIEIIKYTYAGFCNIIFMSLVCAQIGSKYVWWYDGTNVCLENWQVMIVIFAVFYAVPFPLTLSLAMKLLRENKISTAIFICCCLIPLVSLIAMWIQIKISEDSKDQSDTVLSESSKAVISLLQGPYRDDEKKFTLYWEAMVSARRLMITGMTLVSYASIRMIIITALSLIFLVQHFYIFPFQVSNSNDVETLSLSLLVLTSVINLLKASLTDSGVVPSGPTVPFFKGLELCEKMLVLLIIMYILVVEVKFRRGRKSPKQNNSST